MQEKVYRHRIKDVDELWVHCVCMVRTWAVSDWHDS